MRGKRGEGSGADAVQMEVTGVALGVGLYGLVLLVAAMVGVPVVQVLTWEPIGR